MRPKSATDLEIATLAAAQHGVVARSQLLALGLTNEAVARRLGGGRLHAVHRGVYAVGHTVLTKEGRWMAATLATGGVLSHATAAAAWEILPVGAAIHVTVPGDPGRRRRAGIRVHRSRTLTSDDATVRRGIPLTTPERTLADLARTMKGRPLEQLLDRAERRLDFARLRDIAPPSLQAVLSLYTAGSTPTRSELEEALLRLCDDHGLTRPETNTVIEGELVDAAWRDRRLIVEVDGYDFHKGPLKFASDRERDVDLTTQGWRVLRFTWGHVTARPKWVAAKIRLAWREP
jgi:very-short-patch-repair endonuclease